MTARVFSDRVLVNVKGFGVSYTENALNDAFYLFTGPFRGRSLAIDRQVAPPSLVSKR